MPAHATLPTTATVASNAEAGVSGKASRLAPIALFVYARPEHTRRTLAALRRNDLASESDLFVFSDAPKTPKAEENVREVRALIRQIEGFKSVTLFEKTVNKGVDVSVIEGVTQLCDQYGRVIVMEDDLVTSKGFLKYMNQALDQYASDDLVMQISGFMFPVREAERGKACFLPFTSSWGWATWKRAWDQFDASASGFESLKNSPKKVHQFNLNGAYNYFQMLQEFIDGTLDAWDIRWYLSVFLKNGLILFPQQSLVDNIGFDGSGEHCPTSDFASNEIKDFEIDHFPSPVVNVRINRAVERYLRNTRDRRVKKILRGLLPGLFS